MLLSDHPQRERSRTTQTEIHPNAISPTLKKIFQDLIESKPTGSAFNSCAFVCIHTHIIWMEFPSAEIPLTHSDVDMSERLSMACVTSARSGFRWLQAKCDAYTQATAWVEYRSPVLTAPTLRSEDSMINSRFGQSLCSLRGQSQRSESGRILAERHTFIARLFEYNTRQTRLLLATGIVLPTQIGEK